MKVLLLNSTVVLYILQCSIHPVNIGNSVLSQTACVHMYAYVADQGLLYGVNYSLGYARGLMCFPNLLEFQLVQCIGV